MLFCLWRCTISPELIGLNQGIEDGQQFPHGGSQGNFFRFAFCHQALIKDFDRGIASGSHKRCHVQIATDA